MEDLDLQWQYKQGPSVGMALAKENVWSRAARRKRPRLQSDRINEMDVDRASGIGSDDSMVDGAALIVKIYIREDEALVRWLKGLDSVLFESFCGMPSSRIRKSLGCRPLI